MHIIMVSPTQLFCVFHGRFFAKLSPSPPFPVVFFGGLGRKNLADHWAFR